MVKKALPHAVKAHGTQNIGDSDNIERNEDTGPNLLSHSTVKSRYGRAPKLAPASYSTILIPHTAQAEQKGLAYDAKKGVMIEVDVTGRDPANATISVSRIMSGSMEEQAPRMNARWAVGLEVVGEGQLPSGILGPDNRPFGEDPSNPVMPSKLKIKPRSLLGWTSQGKVLGNYLDLSGTSVEFCYDRDGNKIKQIDINTFNSPPLEEDLASGEAIITKIKPPRASSRSKNAEFILRKVYNRIGEPAYFDSHGNVYEPAIIWTPLNKIVDSYGKRPGQAGFDVGQFSGTNDIPLEDIQNFHDTLVALNEISRYIKKDSALLRYLRDTRDIDPNDSKRRAKLKQYSAAVNKICAKIFEDQNPKFFDNLSAEGQKAAVAEMAEGLMYYARDMSVKNIPDPLEYFKDKMFKTGFDFRQKIDVSVTKDNFVFRQDGTTCRVQDWKNDSGALTDEERILLNALRERGFDKNGFMHFNYIDRDIGYDPQNPEKWFCRGEGSLVAVGSANYMDGAIVKAHYGSAVDKHFSLTQYDKRSGKFKIIPANYYSGGMIGKRGVGVDPNPAPERAFLNTMQINDPRKGLRFATQGEICFCSDPNGNDFYENALGFITVDEGAARRWPDGRRAKPLHGFGPNIYDDGTTSKLLYDGMTTKFVSDTKKTWAAWMVETAASWMVQLKKDEDGKAIGIESTNFSYWVLGIDFAKIYKQVIKEESMNLGGPGSREHSSKHLSLNKNMKPIDLIAYLANYADIQNDNDELRIRAKGYEAWQQVIYRGVNDMHQSGRVAASEAMNLGLGVGSLALGSAGLVASVMMPAIPLVAGISAFIVGMTGFAWRVSQTANEERRYITQKEDNSGIIISPNGVFDPQNPEAVEAKQIGSIDKLKADIRQKKGYLKNFVTLGMDFKIDHMVYRPLRGLTTTAYLLMGGGTDKETSAVAARGIIAVCAASSLFALGGPIAISLGVVVATTALPFMGIYLAGKLHGKDEAKHYLMEASHGERGNQLFALREAAGALPIALEYGGHKKRPEEDISKTARKTMKLMNEYAKVTGDKSYKISF